MTEAPLRMLMNNLDPDVAENPHELVVYGGIGRAARTWDDFDRIAATLKTLSEEETLLVQSGKPVGVFRTHKDAPRVLIANSNLVPHWATWDHFNELDKKGLAMYGQMTAGSWIYIGTQGIVQGTYETFVEAGRQHYNGDLKGKWILTGGLGGMGGAQPLAAVMADACCLAVECDESRIDFRLRTRYVDAKAKTLDEALAMIGEWTAKGEAKSVGLLGNAAEIFLELVRRMQAGGPRPDIVTDQTSAHDPRNGYLPIGWTVEEAKAKRESDPTSVEIAARASMKAHVEAMVAFWNAGVPTRSFPAFPTRWCATSACRKGSSTRSACLTTVPCRTLMSCTTSAKASSLDQLLAWSAEPRLLPRVPAGPDRGKTWDRISNAAL